MRAGGIATRTPPEDLMPVTLSPDELAQLACADDRVFRSPIPTRPMSSDEFMPAARTARQREFEQRVNLKRALEGELARTIGTLGSVQNARVHLVLPELFMGC